MTELRGIAASGGIAIAGVLRIRENQKTGTLEGGPAESKKLYNELKKLAHNEFGRLSSLSEGSDAAGMAELFDSYRMIIDDPGFEEAVLGRLDAGAALSDAIKESGEELAASLVALEDEFISARSADVMGVSDELLRQLSRIGMHSDEPEEGTDRSGESFIIVSKRLSPAQLMRIDKQKIEAICLSEGTVNDHTSILAGSMGIPCVVGLGPDLLSGKYEKLVVDGNDGIVFLDPDEAIVKRYEDMKEKFLDLRNKAKLRLLERPLTECGRMIKVSCNISSPDDIDDDTSKYADGVGLFRTEYLYLKTNDYPTEEEQFEAYSAALKKMNGKDVIIRTCDIGFDKAVDYMKLPNEQNPGMGIRGIRISLERPEMFKTQLRALYRASVYGRLKIMFPMISSIWELREARRYCEEVKKELKAEGIKYGNVMLGIMIETPSSALLSSSFAKEADFFSIGSNDLTQYTIGADRINADISRYYDPHHPAVMELIAMTVRNAHDKGIHVGICGELASDIQMMGFFREIGIDELSVTPSRLLEIKMNLLGEE